MKTSKRWMIYLYLKQMHVELEIDQTQLENVQTLLSSSLHTVHT